MTPSWANNYAKHLTPSEIIRGLDPIDWEQMRLLANLTPAQRVLAGMKSSDFARSALRGAFRKRFPELTLPEINMMVLEYLTPIRTPPK